MINYITKPIYIDDYLSLFKSKTWFLELIKKIDKYPAGDFKKGVMVRFISNILMPNSFYDYPGDLKISPWGFTRFLDGISFTDHPKYDYDLMYSFEENIESQPLGSVGPVAPVLPLGPNPVKHIRDPYIFSNLDVILYKNTLYPLATKTDVTVISNIINVDYNLKNL